MHEQNNPTEFNQAVKKLEAYNRGDHLEQVPEQEVVAGGFRHLKRIGAVALTTVVAGLGGAFVGDQMTKHSSVRNYDQQLQQTHTLSVPQRDQLKH